ncbi:PaaI family thioesterase [Streptomyces bottropensis]|jgi:phenylacetic acid degradation protein PaaD|uniref:PaaI family thioesterase n=1 Tax=Streptomyces bottropensis TaxID=42235 RepID=UPI0037F49AD4
MTPDPFTSDGRRDDAGRVTDGQVAKSVRHMLSEDRTCELLGIQVESAAEGRACARMRVRPDMVNGHAIVHGGLVFALADTTFACAVNSYGPPVVTASANITFRLPGHLGDDLIAEAVTRSRQGRSVICEVTVRRGDDVIAEFNGRGAQIVLADGAPSAGSSPVPGSLSGRAGDEEHRARPAGADTDAVDGSAVPGHASGR